MKASYLFTTTLVALLVFGSAQKSSAAEPRIIQITANDTMKFDVTTIEAKPGEKLTVVLTNTGTVPKEVMGHDWVLLKAGSDAAAFANAAIAAKDTDYIPPSLKNEIIAKIGLLGPRKSDQVTFRAPTVPGEYTFLCTFPAHYQAGMHGVLIVK